MDIVDAVRRRILKFLKIENLNGNPNDERLTFICDDNNIKKQALKEYRIWYIGDSNELLNYYSNAMLYGNSEEPIYNKNRRNYFWGISATETNIKRVHSGLPRTIATALTNAVGVPTISMNDEAGNARLKRMLEKIDFMNIMSQQQIPLTLAEGWGAFKVNVMADVSDAPILQYYEAQDVEFVRRSGVLIGIIYKDYYRSKGKDYVLLETRRIANGNSYIEYELFRLGKNDDVIPCKLSEVPELSGLQDVVIEGYNRILGTPSVFFFDPLNKDYGQSIYAGKIDLFDDLDQILSQDSQTIRVSTPVEYYPVDMLERQRNGQPKMPKVYNRQYIKKEATPDGDGASNGTIQTTQPILNLRQYSDDAMEKVKMILLGVISPATLGMDLSKRDNADAQREKEKITIMTRDSIVDREIPIIRDICQILLDMQEYMDTGAITKKENDGLTVSFDGFANASFESELQILGPAWQQGQLSTLRYVQLLWGDKLSEEDLQAEVKWLDMQRNKDNLSLEDLIDESDFGKDSEGEEENGRDADESERGGVGPSLRGDSRKEKDAGDTQGDKENPKRL